MFFFAEESLFYRNIGEREVDGTNYQAPRREHEEAKSSNPNKSGENESETPRIGNHLETSSECHPEPSYWSKLVLWHNYPVSWKVVGKKVAAGVTSIGYPAVLWVCTRNCVS